MDRILYWIAATVVKLLQWPSLPTVARIGRPFDVTRWVRVLNAYRGPTWTAGEVALVQSHLGEGPRRRPRYEVLETFALGR